jgi:hypothetical protein
LPSGGRSPSIEEIALAELEAGDGAAAGGGAEEQAARRAQGHGGDQRLGQIAGDAIAVEGDAVLAVALVVHGPALVPPARAPLQPLEEEVRAAHPAGHVLDPGARAEVGAAEALEAGVEGGRGGAEQAELVGHARA